MSDPSEDMCPMLEHSCDEDVIVERLTSHAEVRHQDSYYEDLEFTRHKFSADVHVDRGSASGYVLVIWVCGYKLMVRPRADHGSAIALRIRGDSVHFPVEVEVPARCLIAERGSDAEQEAADTGVAPVAEDLLTSDAHMRDKDGGRVHARVVRDSKSRSGFALDVTLACGCAVIVRPCDDEYQLVAVRLSGDDEQPAGTVVEVAMPKHVMTLAD